MWTAVVLAGGRATRMGGISKTQLPIAGVTMLDLVIEPLDVPIIVVGPAQPVSRELCFVREEPPFAGPVAAVAAALPFVSTEHLGLLGGDMPAGGELLRQLAAMVVPGQSIVCVDAAGRQQPLCSMLDTSAVRAAVDALGGTNGRALHELFELIAPDEYRVPTGEAQLLRDLDTHQDVAEFPG